MKEILWIFDIPGLPIDAISTLVLALLSINLIFAGNPLTYDDANPLLLSCFCYQKKILSENCGK